MRCAPKVHSAMMKLLLFWTLLAATLDATLAAAQSYEAPIYRAPLQPLTPSGRGVVFGAKIARELGLQGSRASATGYWTSVMPSKNEIKRLERALPGWMKTQKHPRWSGRFEHYRYQYGALIRGKKRLIYVNAVPDQAVLYPSLDERGKPYNPDPRQVWRRGAYVVDDGGPNYWGIEWDVARGKFQNASFNGPPLPAS